MYIIGTVKVLVHYLLAPQNLSDEALIRILHVLFENIVCGDTILELGRIHVADSILVCKEGQCAIIYQKPEYFI